MKLWEKTIYGKNAGNLSVFTYFLLALKRYLLKEEEWTLGYNYMRF